MVLVGAALAHAGLIVAMLGGGAAAPSAPVDGPPIDLALFAGEGFPETATPAAAPERAALVEAAVEIVSAEPAVEAVAWAEPGALTTLSTPQSELAALEAPAAAASLAENRAAAGGGGGCQLARTLQGDLQADAAVQTSLTAVPRDARSVSNAIMLWDGDWVAVKTLPGGDVGPLRRTLLQHVRAASPSCLEQTMSGPLFLMIEGEGGTTFLTVGSGRWRWADLMADEEAAAGR